LLEDRLKTGLLDDYLVQRPALRRFLIARLRDEQVADDILQEIYLKLERTSVGDPIENPSAFLYRVANNLVLDYRKSASRRRVRDHNWADSQTVMMGADAVYDVPDTDAALDARRKLAQINAAIENLPAQCRTILKACKIQGMTYQEAATKYDISVSTVGKHMSKALKYLLQHVENDREEP